MLGPLESMSKGLANESKGQMRRVMKITSEHQKLGEICFAVPELPPLLGLPSYHWRTTRLRERMNSA